MSSKKVDKTEEMWTGELIEGSRCPRCSKPLAYNGNYWCSVCPYVMPDYPQMRQADKDAFNVAYVLLMQQRGKDPDVNSLM